MAFGRLQEALWRFQGALGRLQEVFSVIFEGLGRNHGRTGLATGLGQDPLNQEFSKKTENRETVKALG